MKRLILTAGLALAVLVPGAAQAKLSHHEAIAYGRAFAHVEHVLGHGTAGCKLIGKHATCRRSTDKMVRKSTDTLHRMLAPAPVVHYSAPAVSYTAPSTSTSTSTSSTSYSSSGSYSDVPGVPSSFAACVAERESSNGAGSSNIYGDLVDPRGNGSIAEQKQAFSELYAANGTAPWSPYDGC